MQRTDGAIPIEQWTPDGFKIMTLLAEILGRQEGCVYEVVPANPENGVNSHDEVLQQVMGA